MSIPDQALARLERRAADYPPEIRDEIYASTPLIGPLAAPQLPIAGIGLGVPGGTLPSAVQCQFPPCRTHRTVRVELGRGGYFAQHPGEFDSAAWPTVREAIDRALDTFPGFLERPAPGLIVIHAVGSSELLDPGEEDDIPEGIVPGGRMKTCEDIRILWTELLGGDDTREMVVHELFHCLHLESHRQPGQTGLELWQESAGTEPPYWVVEGMATWAEELAYPHLNSPWDQYERYASGPQRSLGELAHDAGLFMRFLEQYDGVGALKLILDTYPAAGPKDLPPVSGPAGFPDSWLDFGDATTGYHRRATAGVASARLRATPDLGRLGR